ncbi:MULTISPECIES: hypothetical protein [unclassified Vibrio]|uniref:hypothetical protein n=1 Tax=unclassified Vibrio TaxID=2614977 RepID=UPI001267AB8A|nr:MULTISPECIES: hypothetical protein [unclassified Vibrio]QFT40032.1 hypothetical protein FIU99_26950 [Vibrio sp. THAF64]QGM37977.1 hypothetical protein GGC04_27155 [Vibrio sp. THAF191d]QGN73443.1 hypothetical protein GGC03_27020 [Vibrio sp. THAF191c]
MDITPKRAMAYLMERQRLKGELDKAHTKIASLKEDLEYMKEIILNGPTIPDHVRQWMRDYDLVSWELFKCQEHDEWFTQLDPLFPNHWELCRCEKCT